MASSLAALAAALVALAPGADGAAVAAAPLRGGTEALKPVALVIPQDAALAALPLDPLGGVLGALAPAPATVVRKTRYYGTVTIDHRGHLARRHACKTCHGPGPVSKIQFTPKVAHDRCIGCHQEQARGPDRCAGCHVREAPPARLAAAGDAAPGAAPPQPSGPNPANVAAALAAHDASGWAGDTVAGREPFHRILELGLAAGRGQGLSVRLASHQDGLVFTQSVDLQRSGAEARTFALVGAGVVHAARGAIRLEAVGLAGLDAVDRPVTALFPALGARASLEWRARSALMPRVSASLTGVVDLSRRAFGRDVGGTCLYATLSTGFRVP